MLVLVDDVEDDGRVAGQEVRVRGGQLDAEMLAHPERPARCRHHEVVHANRPAGHQLTGSLPGEPSQQCHSPVDPLARQGGANICLDRSW